MSKSSNIKITVSLDDKNVPEKIEWHADDLKTAQDQEAKAMMVAFFDGKTKDTMRIDLWTKEMQVNEMDRFMFQTLRSMTDSYYKATQNAKLSSEMMQFVNYFGQEIGLLKKEDPS